MLLNLLCWASPGNSASISIYIQVNIISNPIINPISYGDTNSDLSFAPPPPPIINILPFAPPPRLHTLPDYTRLFQALFSHSHFHNQPTIYSISKGNTKPGDRVAIIGDGKLGLLIGLVLIDKCSSVIAFGHHADKLG